MSSIATSLESRRSFQVKTDFDLNKMVNYHSLLFEVLSDVLSLEKEGLNLGSLSRWVSI
jgi:hypothetical protein